jgi:hypothetical protein
MDVKKIDIQSTYLSLWYTDQRFELEGDLKKSGRKLQFLYKFQLHPSSYKNVMIF